MRVDDFWSSPAAWPYLYGRRRARTRYLEIANEPESKGTRGTRAALDCQRQALQQLADIRAGVLTVSLALDLHCTVGRKNPPMIHNIAKWALDVLGPVSPDLDVVGRGQVLYRDDRQVKLLSVRLDQAWRGDTEAPAPGESWIVARPIRDVVADLDTAQRLHRGEGLDELELDEDECHETWNSIYGDDDEDDDDLDWQGEDGIPEDLRPWHRFYQQERVQRQLLATTDRILTNALHTTPHLISGARPPRHGDIPQLHDLLRQVEITSWQFLVTGPIAAPLPDLPDAPGSRDHFRQEVRRQLQQFCQRWLVLTPLLVPLKITLLVVPSRQGKDLDNIALDVLPIAHEVFRPHIKPWLLAPTTDADPERERLLRRMRSLNAQSVIGYQVIELHRLPHSGEQGTLRLALGCGDDPSSPWDKAETFVGRCLW